MPTSITRPVTQPVARQVAITLLTLGTLLLSGCGAITLKTDPGLSSRAVPSTRTASSTISSAAAASATAAKADATPAEVNPAEGLRLARLLRDQGRLEGASGVYAELDRRGLLKPTELLEYASVAATVQTPADSLMLFGRARRAITTSGTKLETLPRPAVVALCNGLGRARLAMGQTDAALTDFDCTLKADGDNVDALNAKGVLLDALGQHTQAQQLLSHASELAPGDFRVLNNLALSHLAAGQTQQAIRLLTQNQAPRWPALKLNLSLAYALQGQPEQARKTLLAVMPATLADRALQDFEQRRQRIDQGEPIALELLAASRQLLALQDPKTHD